MFVTSLRMDESVELFKVEQKRLDDAGGPAAYIRKSFANSVVTLVAVSISFLTVVAFLSLFPRNPDNSVKLAVYGPVLVTLAILAALILKFARPNAQAIRWTCWAFIGVGVTVIPMGIVELLGANRG
jgi:chromate transport protein ChrA